MKFDRSSAAAEGPMGAAEDDVGEPGYREKLRESALAITQRLIETEGVEAAQARRIAKEANCAVGSLYNVFGDIDGLILALNTQTLGALGDALQTASHAAAGGDLGDRLNALALGYLRFAEANRGLWDAVFRYRRAAAKPVPESYLADQGRLLGLIEAELVAVIADPETRRQAARALFGSVHGIVGLAIEERMGGRAHNDYEAQIRFIVGLAEQSLKR